MRKISKRIVMMLGIFCLFFLYAEDTESSIVIDNSDFYSTYSQIFDAMQQKNDIRPLLSAYIEAQSTCYDRDEVRYTVLAKNDVIGTMEYLLFLDEYSKKRYEVSAEHFYLYLYLVRKSSFENGIDFELNGLFPMLFINIIEPNGINKYEMDGKSAFLLVVIKKLTIESVRNSKVAV